MPVLARIENELSWSRSRSLIFEECRRKYWFRYYGHWGGWEPNCSERTRAAYVLGKLQTRWMWAGDLVHRIIAETLEVMRAGGQKDMHETAERAVAIMRTEFDQSRKKKYWQNPKRHVGLLEHEYDIDVPKEHWAEVADHVRHCVKGFFQSPFPAQLKDIPGSAWFPIEGLAHFTIDKLRIYVKPDFAYRDGETAVIIDWKTGRYKGDPDPLQLAGYAIFGMENGWAEEPEAMMTVEYNLFRGDSVEEFMTPERLTETRTAIRASLADMAPLHEKPEAAFPVTDDPRVCRDCFVRKICTEKPS